MNTRAMPQGDNAVERAEGKRIGIKLSERLWRETKNPTVIRYAIEELRRLEPFLIGEPSPALGKD